MQVKATEFITLDGVVAEPQTWSFPYWNDETQNFKLDELRKTDGLLLGRKTYEAFAKSWPSRAGDEFSDKFNAMPKYVVSKTLKQADWNNSHILGPKLKEEIAKFKAKPGQDLVVHGSVSLTRWLIQNNLLDGLNLLVYPLLLGEGLKLFDDTTKGKLKLIESNPYKTGVVLMTYKHE
ncbi:hypothetical protein AUI06_11800 [archaeon 13_2_20CM_2_52_21]|nr:MAG: hypothetical protein AUI06_11800 [archaeon 13_2_20CM_2_52_21]